MVSKKVVTEQNEDIIEEIIETEYKPTNKYIMSYDVGFDYDIEFLKDRVKSQYGIDLKEDNNEKIIFEGSEFIVEFIKK